MKKLFIVMAVASLGFVACNNDSSDTVEAKRIADSTRIADSLAKVAKDAPPVDPAVAMEIKRVADSTRVADSLKAAGNKMGPK